MYPLRTKKTSTASPVWAIGASHESSGSTENSQSAECEKTTHQAAMARAPAKAVWSTRGAGRRPGPVARFSGDGMVLLNDRTAVITPDSNSRMLLRLMLLYCVDCGQDIMARRNSPGAGDRSGTRTDPGT
ncbi:hypothetical protein PLANTIT3_30384 [Plantibacter sp. T3]|nr:hypothetical protein PLANTIT3_30384 [Plantibacter sp. T3]